MESLSTLGLSVQARVPAQGPGCRGVTGPPGGASESTAREDRVAFAAALRQSFGAGALQSAPPGTRGKRPAEARLVEKVTPDEGEARCADQGAEGTSSAQRPKKGGSARAPDETAALAVPAPVAMPLDLLEGATTREAAPEPRRVGAKDDLTVMALAPSDATRATRATVPSATVPTAQNEAVAMDGAGTPAAAPLSASPDPRGGTTQAESLAPETTTASQEEAPVVSGSEATGVPVDRVDRQERPSPTGHAVPPRATLQVDDRPRSASVADRTPPAAPAPADPHRQETVDETAPIDLPTDAAKSGADRPEAARAAVRQGGARAEQGDPSAGHAPSGAAMPTKGAPPRAAPVEQASPQARPVSAGAGDSNVERPGRRQHGTPAAGAPEILPGDAHATVVHWLHGSERVDDVQAQRQVQHILVSNLAEDIHRLTFVGQSRAILQLQPPDLGKLSIHLTMQEGGLAVEMVVETEAIRAIVESTLDQLQTALAQHGLATAGVFVQVGESAHRDGEEWQARRSREPRGVPAAAGRADGATPAAQGRHLGYDSTVDYRI